MPFSIVDLVVIAVVVISALIALVRGFTREVLSVMAWIGAAVAALYLLPFVQPLARRHLSPDLLADGIAGISIFIVSLVLLSYLSHRISERVRGSPVGALDHTLGFVFGVLRGALLISIAFLFTDWMIGSDEEERPEWLREARTLPLMEAGAGTLIALAPSGLGDEEAAEEAREAVDSAAERARKTLEEAAGAAGKQSVEELLGPDSDSESGYKSSERRALDNLFRATEKDDVEN